MTGLPTPYGGGYLPPGCALYDVDFELACPNRECPRFGQVVKLTGYFELGATYLHDEAEWCCPECEAERLDPVEEAAAFEERA